MQHGILCNGDSWDYIYIYFLYIYLIEPQNPGCQMVNSHRDRMLLWHELKWRVKRWREQEKKKREEEILASHLSLSSLHFVLCCLSVHLTEQSDNKNVFKKERICTTLMVWHLYCTNIKPSPPTAEEKPVNELTRVRNLQMSPLQQSSQGLLFLQLRMLGWRRIDTT